MSKKEKIKPEGKMGILNYLSDRGGVGYIRTIWPFTYLGTWRYEKMTFEPTYVSQFINDEGFYKTQAFVRFQRSATRQHMEMIRYFQNHIKKRTNTPTIYEIDDLLFNIPVSNFAANYYVQNQPYVEEILRLVDGITVSTPTLRKHYLKFNSNISVVRNRLVRFMWGEIKECKPIKRKEKPRILYPGSQNHFAVKDVTEEGGDIQGVLLDYINKTKKDNYEWIFVGGLPSELVGDPDIKYLPWVNLSDYPRFMKNVDVDIAIAPLEINEFNASKSDLKALEYCVSGIPAVYTKIDPYENMNLTAETEEDMISKIEWLLKNEDNRYQTWKKDTNKLKKKMFFEDNVKQWMNEHLKLFKREL